LSREQHERDLPDLLQISFELRFAVGDVADDATKIEPPSCVASRRKGPWKGRAREEANDFAPCRDLGFTLFDSNWRYSRLFMPVRFGISILTFALTSSAEYPKQFFAPRPDVGTSHDAARIDQDTLRQRRFPTRPASARALARARSADLSSGMSRIMPTKSKPPP